MWLSPFVLRLDPTSDSGGGPGDPTPKSPDPNDATSLMEGFRKRLEESDRNAAKLAERLYGESYNWQRKYVSLEAESKQKDAELAKYRALGDLETITRFKGDLDSTTAELTKFRRDATVRTVADATGLDADILKLALPADAAVELKEAKDGKKSALVKIGESEAKPVEDWLKAEHPSVYKLMGQSSDGGNPPARQRNGSPPSPHVRQPMPEPGANATKTNGQAQVADLIRHVGMPAF